MVCRGDNCLPAWFLVSQYQSQVCSVSHKRYNCHRHHGYTNWMILYPAARPSNEECSNLDYGESGLVADSNSSKPYRESASHIYS